MAKTHRGKALWNLPARGRGTCPICKATRIKVLYQRTAPDGAVVKVCKRCRRKSFPVNEPAAGKPAAVKPEAERVLKELELA